ncbi:hypothetical protein WG904_12440 [Pedobacter sp. Du54]|uniref:hypothetical protein n=1 Tax=Pedobacter anseongensis TaxID=3133439 RepID=UPI0030974CF7
MKTKFKQSLILAILLVASVFVLQASTGFSNQQRVEIPPADADGCRLTSIETDVCLRTGSNAQGCVNNTDTLKWNCKANPPVE